MSDEPKESGWQGFLRKTKYQWGGRKSSANRYGDANWEAEMLNAISDGFLGNYDTAVDALDEILQNTYERFEKALRTDAFSAKATALEKLGRTDEALATYDKAIELGSDQEHLYHNKGYLLSNLGRHSEALVCFSKEVELTKDYEKDDEEDVKHHADALSSLAEAHSEMETTNDLNIALKLVDKSIKLNPKSAFAFQTKAVILADALIEKYDEALENCEKGLKIDPTDEDLLSLRALIYLNMEKYDLAEKHFLELLNHDPSQPTTHYNLACIYSLLKNKP